MGVYPSLLCFGNVGRGANGMTCDAPQHNEEQQLGNVLVVISGGACPLWNVQKHSLVLHLQPAESLGSRPLLTDSKLQTSACAGKCEAAASSLTCRLVVADCNAM